MGAVHDVEQSEYGYSRACEGGAASGQRPHPSRGLEFVLDDLRVWRCEGIITVLDATPIFGSGITTLHYR